MRIGDGGVLLLRNIRLLGVLLKNLDVFCEFVDALAAALYPRCAERFGGVDERVVLFGPDVVETVAAFELFVEKKLHVTRAVVNDALFEESLFLDVGVVQLVDERYLRMVVEQKGVLAAQTVGARLDNAVAAGEGLRVLVLQASKGRAVVCVGTTLATCRHRHDGDKCQGEEVFTIHRRHRC